MSEVEEEHMPSFATAGPAVPAGASVPFVDLTSATDAVRDEIVGDLERLLRTNAFVNGPQVAEFEDVFARWCGVDECVGMASGLDALRLGLLALEVGPGDEVVVPALTFVATFEAVSQTGARPVAVDVSDEDYCLDGGAVEASLTAGTRALLPVHLYGQLADMRRLGAVADAKGVALVEDACQAHGAARDHIRPGTASSWAAFSFYPSKNLGAFGDAGAVVTHDRALAHRLRALREHGETTKYHSEWPGYTARLDTFQACVLLRKLPHLSRWNAERAGAAEYYSQALAGIGDLRLPPVAPGSEHVWHLYVVRTSDRRRLAEYLRERGIGTGHHYPQLPHRSAAFAHLGYTAGAFPVAEAVADEALSLPLFPGITEAQLQQVCDGVASYFGAAPR